MRFSPAPPLIVSLKHIFLVGLLMASCLTAPAQAGWQKDEVCQGSCGGSCGPCPDSGGSGAGGTPAAGASQALQLQTAGQAGFALGTYIRESGEAADRQAALKRQQQLEEQAAADRQVSEVARQHEIERQRLFGENKDKILQQLNDIPVSQADEASQERGLSRMCQSEMTQRRADLAALKGSPDVNWCKLNLIHVRCPTRPLNDVAGQYSGMVERYIDWKNKWDRRCGGPAVKPGYRSFDAEMRSTKILPPASSKSPPAQSAPSPVLVQVGSEQLALKDEDTPPAPPRNSVPVTPFEWKKPALDSEPALPANTSVATASDTTAVKTVRRSPTPVLATAKPTPLSASAVTALTPGSSASRSTAATTAGKVFDCAVKSFFASSGDASFETDVRSETRRALAELANASSPRQSDAQTGYTLSRDTQVHSRTGDGQAILEATFQRVDSTGEWRVDVQYALSRPGSDSLEGQTIATLNADGKIISVDSAPETQACLGR